MSIETPAIQNEQGQVIPESMAEIISVNIGGIQQYLMIRGEHKDSPILLCIHGGPGQSEIGYIRPYQEALEKRFLVVRWDQRGAGLSASPNLPQESFSLSHFVSDTLQVTDYLIQRFNQPKIFITGHSWGSILATHAVQNSPEKYRAYIGVGQFVDAQKSEVIAYQHSVAEAKRQNNADLLEQLESIGQPPYDAPAFLVRAKCLSQLGGVFKTAPSIDMGQAFMTSTEYSPSVKSDYMPNAMASSEVLAPEILQVRFLEDIHSFDLPVYFIMGKHDYHTPTAMVEQFYHQITAPQKELILFENSAHMPQLEEHQAFNQTLIRILDECCSG